jgi:hypothetical protein
MRNYNSHNNKTIINNPPMIPKYLYLYASGSSSITMYYQNPNPTVVRSSLACACAMLPSSFRFPCAHFLSHDCLVFPPLPLVWLQHLVTPKGKATITWWEKEIKEKRKGKAWDALTQEVNWVTDPGATQPKETLYQKTVEMAWQTKMMIGKVILKMEDARLEDNKEHKKMLNEILSRLNSLETITKLLAEVEKDQKAKMELLVAQFHLYLRYVHDIDITPSNRNGAATHIKKTRMISQKEENKGQADEGKKHIIVLD